jgi:hypothetical protein
MDSDYPVQLLDYLVSSFLLGQSRPCPQKPPLQLPMDRVVLGTCYAQSPTKVRKPLVAHGSATDLLWGRPEDQLRQYISSQNISWSNGDSGFRSVKCGWERSRPFQRLIVVLRLSFSIKLPFILSALRLLRFDGRFRISLVLSQKIPDESLQESTPVVQNPTRT